ncbi:helix-turn-helix domain-containing protein [Sanguibacter biliveldensis]|uniref:helix-turn-helix domain-containing protein n=1 Tax=Sanguibacter biliveldensis TaxID=3030830 RepID=UPI0038CD6CDC
MTIHDRPLLVQRVLDRGRPLAHVDREFRISRQCANRWVHRVDAQGSGDLADRSSPPRSMPAKTRPMR